MKILILSGYPIENPLHGGQIRVHNIAKTYRNAGNTVLTVGTAYNYPASAGYINNIPHDFIIKYSLNYMFVDDLAIGEALCHEEKLYKQLTEQIHDRPDILQIEQPWLYKFARRYIHDQLNDKASLIYSSQNIEYNLKQKIFDQYNIVDSDNIIENIKNLEIAAIQNSSGVVCVSENDLMWTKQYTDKPVLLAPNGVSPWTAKETCGYEAHKISRDKPFAVFCGSAHPPNLSGFFDMLDGGFGSLNTGQQLLIIGGIGSMIETDPRFKSSAKLAARTTILGIIDDGSLHAILDVAHCIILPITQGGGTNLKTAEALWSGKYIVATTTAMRGFEKFMKSRGVFIADSGPEFKCALRKVMELPPLVLTEQERCERKCVLWKSCLSGLPTFAENIYKEAWSK